jgi:porphobilinogen synthase
MPGQFRYAVDDLGRIFDVLLKAGVNKVLFFGVPDEKDSVGSGAWRDDGVVQRALRRTKDSFPEIFCVGDVCMCEYTDHGHCGVLKDGAVDNDASLAWLARIALSQARAGADMIAPSDMMDGRVAAIRRVLDGEGFLGLPIMSYAAKYASAFYGPFRVAAGSAPAFGDRKGYQMDFHNVKEAVKEALADVAEGADIIMVKPALSYLDVVRRCAEALVVPLAAFSVSGEYAMIKAAGAAGFIDEDGVVAETAVSVFRAGADILISYFAVEIARLIDAGRVG